MDIFFNSQKPKSGIDIEEMPVLQQYEEKKETKKANGLKIKRIKRCDKWDAKTYKLISIGNILDNFKVGKIGGKRFKINIQYSIQGDPKKKQATIAFGKKDVKYYIDHHDVDQRKNQSQRLRRSANPFEASFWVLWLLLNKPTIQESRADFSM